MNIIYCEYIHSIYCCHSHFSTCLWMYAVFFAKLQNCPNQFSIKLNSNFFCLFAKMVQKYPTDRHLDFMEHQSTNFAEIVLPTTGRSKVDHQNSYSIPFFVRQRAADNFTNSSHDQQHEDDFFKSIKSFLIFGKLIGVLPFSGIFGNSWKDLSFRLLRFT